MTTKHISSLFNELGISPGYKGYPYLIHIVSLAENYYGRPLPCLKDLYQQTAEYFEVSDNKVKDDIRTLLRTYWDQKNAARFTSVIGFPVHDRLTSKEFIATVAEYLALNSLS